VLDADAITGQGEPKLIARDPQMAAQPPTQEAPPQELRWQGAA